MKTQTRKKKSEQSGYGAHAEWETGMRNVRANEVGIHIYSGGDFSPVKERITER